VPENRPRQHRQPCGEASISAVEPMCQVVLRLMRRSRGRSLFVLRRRDEFRSRGPYSSLVQSSKIPGFCRKDYAETTNREFFRRFERTISNRRQYFRGSQAYFPATTLVIVGCWGMAPTRGQARWRRCASSVAAERDITRPQVESAGSGVRHRRLESICAPDGPLSEALLS
jgi:hypothetical protein